MSSRRSNFCRLLHVICIFAILLGVVFIGNTTGSLLKFTNIKCVAFDKSYADFRYCRLNVPQRGKIALDLYVELYQVPASNVSINLSLWKKASGYRPFLYNYSTDFCKFVAKSSRLSFLRIFFDMLLKDSNINHSCPYNHDIIVKNMILRDEYFRQLPLPFGEYMFNLKVAAYNDWKADVKAYASINLN